MNFFCTKKHYDDWAAGRTLDQGTVFPLDLAEGVEVARQLFGHRD